MKSKAHLIALSALCVLSACGTAPKERATGGAAAGAATGAAVGALAGPPGMVMGMQSTLEEIGVPLEDVRDEEFYGY